MRHIVQSSCGVPDIMLSQSVLAKSISLPISHLALPSVQIGLSCFLVAFPVSKGPEGKKSLRTTSTSIISLPILLHLC